MAGGPTDIELVPVSREAADAVLGGGSPAGFDVPDDYPSAFSAGVADSVGKEGIVGPFFMRRLADGVVVGEIGGAFTDAPTVEIGYAVVDSQAGRGYATAAVLELAGAARRLAPKPRRLVAHTPLDRPASGKVLAKAGFEDRGETLDEHEGVPLTVKEWVWPGSIAYASARWALRGFSTALRVDLRGTGVSVTDVVMGKIASTYWDNNAGAEERIPPVSRLVPTLSPERAAEVVARAVERERRLATAPTMYSVFHHTGRLFPGLVHRVVAAGGPKWPAAARPAAERAAQPRE